MKKILVIGDVMIDEYVTVAIDRISPEAPVPVMRVLSRCSCPGGAANVAANVESLGEPAILVGDLSEYGASGIKRKTRFIVKSGQQVARCDEEDTSDLTPAMEDRICGQISLVIDTSDVGAIVISDYAKGVCTKHVCQYVIRQAHEKKVPIIVDPKRIDWRRYAGASIITPNEHEWESADPVIKKLFPYILITLGDRGVKLLSNNTDAEQSFASAAHSVADVTGAGDTVVAALAVGLSEGMSMPDAARFANRAAGIVVGKRGTATVTMEEIRASGWPPSCG